MKILVSDMIGEQANANACKAIIDAECPAATEVTTRLESLSASIAWAIANGYEIISRSTTGLNDARNENEGDTAWAGDEIIKVGIVHSLGSNSHIRDTDPSYLDIICSVSAGDGSGNCDASYGLGLEFFYNDETDQSYATARIAGIIGQMMIDHPTWNFHDCRMALRQTASLYATGWVEDGGYGYVDKVAATAVSTIAMFSPMRQVVVHDDVEKTITFTWVNSPQSGFSAIIVVKYGASPERDAVPTQGDAEILYNGVLETYEHSYSGTFLGNYYFVFHTSGSYSLIESFDVSEIDTGDMEDVIRLTSSIKLKISLTSSINMEEA